MISFKIYSQLLFDWCENFILICISLLGLSFPFTPDFVVIGIDFLLRDPFIT